MGKNFRGEPGKVEKAVLKSLELKILVLNRHVPILRIWIKSPLLSKMRKNAVSIEVANIELRWEFLFFLQTPS